MSKLPEENRFIDLSDYGRPVARIIALACKETSITPIHITISFIFAGLLAIACILKEYYWAAAAFLILKSILDAADGELARIKNTPSYTGRYFDSVSDVILNFLFLITIAYTTDGSILYTLLAFIGIQLQGTLYNYYYVILRNRFDGDTTSRIFEDRPPTAMKGERQEVVNTFFRLYHLLYSQFDKTIYQLDPGAVKASYFPNWFMTAVSTFGLGFQLLIISFMLVLHLNHYIIPFFIGYSVFIFVFIGVRKLISRTKLTAL